MGVEVSGFGVQSQELMSRVEDLEFKVWGLGVASGLGSTVYRLGSASMDTSFRALCGRLKFTVRRHKYNTYSLFGVEGLPREGAS